MRVSLVNRVYEQAEKVLTDTNTKVSAAKDIVDGLRKDNLLTGAPFSNPIDFIYFDLWHYDGRTSKHGAFMGGADFVQWHGNYPMLSKTVELRSMAEEMRKKNVKVRALQARLNRARSNKSWVGRWTSEPLLWVEGFVLFNFLCSTLNIYLAHSTNAFRRESEYIPLYFSAIAPFILFAGLVARERFGHAEIWRDLGHLVGWLAVVIGLTGVVLHLDIRFFYERTIKSLTYAAPFAAPLAYTGLGLLLIVNRMVKAETAEWAYWIMLLALGGFLGNFVFSLTDYATNGFYRPVEWLPVASSAFAVSFLLVPFLFRAGRRFLIVCALVLILQALNGVLGFFLHAAADIEGPSASALENVVHGAPPLAPLLFPNLVLLGLIALWALSKHLPANEVSQLEMNEQMQTEAGQAA